MKKLLALLTLLAVFAFSAGCGGSSKSSAWDKLTGSYTKEGSSQYNNGVLQLKPLEGGCVLFEFRLMEGSEAADESFDTEIAGVMIADDKSGKFETLPDAEKKATISFALVDSGKKIKVTHTGDLPLSPDGTYSFTESDIQVSDGTARNLIENLPSAATSLKGGKDKYALAMPDALIGDWFYPVEAKETGSGNLLARFLVAKDLSAVYRADEEDAPATLIFGSAKPMLKAETYFAAEDETAGNNIAEETGGDEPTPIISAALAKGAFIKEGETDEITVVMPWPLKTAIKDAKSDKPEVVAVSGAIVTAKKKGTAKITGKIAIDDGEKDFDLTVTVIK